MDPDETAGRGHGCGQDFDWLHPSIARLKDGRCTPVIELPKPALNAIAAPATAHVCTTVFSCGVNGRTV